MAFRLLGYARSLLKCFVDILQVIRSVVLSPTVARLRLALDPVVQFLRGQVSAFLLPLHILLHDRLRSCHRG